MERLLRDLQPQSIILRHTGTMCPGTPCSLLNCQAHLVDFPPFFMFGVSRQLVNFLFRGIEDVISILIRAAVAKGGVESLVDSIVCVLEAHNPSSRGILNQERLEDEVMVVWRGCNEL